MLRAIILGAIQGLTEFVPVSSTGHLVLVPYLLGWRVDQPVPMVPALVFDVGVHVGTLIAVVAYFWKDLWGLLVGSLRAVTGRGDGEDRATLRFVGMLAVASIPAGAAGLFLGDLFEQAFSEPQIAAAMLLVTAALLLLADRIHARRAEGTVEHRPERALRVGDALVIGVMQATAILPGISRSGATIAAGVVLGLSREAAARFSFLLAIPAIAGAGLLEFVHVGERASPITPELVVAAVIAAVVGFAAIWFLLRYLRRGALRPFAIYCAALAVVGLVFWLQVK